MFFRYAWSSLNKISINTILLPFKDLYKGLEQRLTGNMQQRSEVVLCVIVGHNNYHR